MHQIGSHQIEFWFDFGSPYAYFGALEIEDVAERYGRTVAWRPFMLGAVFATTGMRLLTETPLRGDYARHDWQRLARKLSAPFALPAGFPAHSANPGRAFYWLRERLPISPSRSPRPYSTAILVKASMVSARIRCSERPPNVAPMSASSNWRWIPTN